MFAALGLRCVVTVDPEQEDVMRPHWEPGQAMQRRNKRLARLGKTAIARALPEVMRELAKRQSDKMTPAQRRAQARKAGKASGRARLRRGLIEAVGRQQAV